MRGTTRNKTRLEGIEADGIEAVQADPERPGTILELVGDVALVIWLLGSASGDPGEIEAIHGPRLERLLEKLVETPVRGFAYEAAGSVAGEVLDRGTAIVDRAAMTWRIPVTILRHELPPGEGGEWEAWAGGSAAQVSELLGA